MTNFFPSLRKYQGYFVKELFSIGNACEIKCYLALIVFPFVIARSGGSNLAVDLWLTLPRKSSHGRDHKQLTGLNSDAKMEMFVPVHITYGNFAPIQAGCNGKLGVV